MCLLTYLGPGVAPDEAALLAGAAVNTDGHGYAVATGSGVISRASADESPERMVAEFTRIRANYPEHPAIFHSRWTTEGTISPENTQPFKLADGSVFAHQGTIPGLAHDGLSDSAVLAANLGANGHRGINFCEINRVMARHHSHAVYLAPSGASWRMGEWEYSRNGIWYSGPEFIVPAHEHHQSHARLLREFAYREWARRAAEGDEIARKLMHALLTECPSISSGAYHGREVNQHDLSLRAVPCRTQA